MKGRVFVNIERCMACKRCVLACAVEHSQSKELFASMTEVPAPRPRVQLTQVGGAPVPTECRHCDAAACVAACPTGALSKDGQDGPVLLRAERCVGCGSCVVACPYGVVRQHTSAKRLYKCDLCIERLARDREPACVEACPTGCLSFRAPGKIRTWLEATGAVQASPGG
ncbi:MAG: 4Fe-4S binding protein [Deltaproteobacteria bacterium]|nr:4Fe-4S binding protein [Deltaproteobacteria bacterium]